MTHPAPGCEPGTGPEAVRGSGECQTLRIPRRLPLTWVWRTARGWARVGAAGRGGARGGGGGGGGGGPAAPVARRARPLALQGQLGVGDRLERHPVEWRDAV